MRLIAELTFQTSIGAANDPQQPLANFWNLHRAINRNLYEQLEQSRIIGGRSAKGRLLELVIIVPYML